MMFVNDRNNILLCPDNLSIGKICPFAPSKRWAELQSYGTELSDDFVKTYKTFLEKINEIEDEPIRLWISNSPHELLGLYFISHWIYPRIQEIYLCHMSDLPYANIEENCLSCLPENEWAALCSMARRVSIKEYSIFWEKLLKQNSEIRILLSGQIVSVGADYFDKDILSTRRKLQTDDVYMIADAVSNSYSQKENAVFTIYFFLYRTAQLLSTAS